MKRLLTFLKGQPTILIGLLLLIALILMAVLAPWVGTLDPTALNPVKRTQGPSADFWFGTDLLGRDVYSRVVYGARVSLIVGFSVAIFSTLIGTVIGLAAGFTKWVDAIVMRIMDGFMSIPTILLAIALIAVTSPSMKNVIVAITIAEVPRVVRLIRGLVLTLREQPYVEAAVASGASTMRIIAKHIFPNTVAALTVQATYICGVAILAEASLSFIGAGVPPATPSWGNIMAEGRALWQIKPYLIAFPALFLSITILAINMLGDGLRDAIDPRMTRRSGE
ncbi:binding-protein-dependent transport systems inner membrane protein [Bordetella ansorpii]|uniref:Binding-protein-dependent transport systems inner membrane protein n=1 Tax=Bordetella ansorpii TaxID=288768 RepID=A0A157RAU6_9BORD|nr:ABC transporter permease [Bordetella ansorpii]SAI54954.1 binding-protein-dependent transport systems inner membrane protein [Bordetella ansorpii]